MWNCGIRCVPPCVAETCAVASRFRIGRENRMGGFRKGGFSNNRFVLKPDVAIASEVSILSKNSLAITDFHAKKTQHAQLFENPLPGTPPFAIPQIGGKGAVGSRSKQMRKGL